MKSNTALIGRTQPGLRIRVGTCSPAAGSSTSRPHPSLRRRPRTPGTPPRRAEAAQVGHRAAGPCPRAPRGNATLVLSLGQRRASDRRSRPHAPSSRSSRRRQARLGLRAMSPLDLVERLLRAGAIPGASQPGPRPRPIDREVRRRSCPRADDLGTAPSGNRPASAARTWYSRTRTPCSASARIGAGSKEPNGSMRCRSCSSGFQRASSSAPCVRWISPRCPPRPRPAAWPEGAPRRAVRQDLQRAPHVRPGASRASSRSSPSGGGT